jgi:hypothetical protein
MIFLAFVLAIVLLAGFFETEGRRNGRNYHRQFILVACFLLALQSGLRHEAVGADTFAYKLKFDDSTQASWAELFDQVTDYYAAQEGKDPGYPVFQKLSAFIVPNYQVYLLLVAGIFFLALGLFIKRNTRTVPEALIAFLLYLTLFYGFYSITGTRQTLAAACTLFGYEFLIKRRKFWLFLFLMLVVSTIHKSILSFIPFYFIAFIKPRKWHYCAMVIIFPVLMHFSGPIFSSLGELSGYEQYGEDEGAGSYRFTLILLLFSAVAFWRMRFVLREGPSTRPLYNALLLTIFFTPLTWVNPLAMRVVQYYSIFMVALAPKLATSFRLASVKTGRLAYGACLGVLLAYAVFRGLNTEYAFFWQEMELPENYD